MLSNSLQHVAFLGWPDKPLMLCPVIDDFGCLTYLLQGFTPQKIPMQQIISLHLCMEGTEEKVRRNIDE